ncbi:MAG: hypothetical protein ACR2G7_08035 [Acidimicrobiales bacterium]
MIEPGAFVLGYGKLTPWPKLSGHGPAGEAFGRNGTYLVVRQLAQDVAGFWRPLDERTKDGDGRQQQGPDGVARFQAGGALAQRSTPVVGRLPDP